MKIFTSLLTLSVYCLFLSTADAEISAKTPKQRCEVFRRINSNSANETDETDQKQLKAIYESNLKKHEQDKNNTFFYVEPNRSCSDKYAQNSYFTNKIPCNSLKVNNSLTASQNSTPFCRYDPRIIIDRVMMQEYVRANYPNADISAPTETTERSIAADRGGHAGEYPVVYWSIDKKYEHGQFVHGWMVQEIKKKPFSYKERAEQWCYSRFYPYRNVVEWKTLHTNVDDGQYVCWFTYGDKNKNLHNEENGVGKRACDDINEYISQMQKSVSDSTLIGATAEWKIITTQTKDGKPVPEYHCVITIPQ